ncbi:MAG: ABC transporter permease [Bacteroidota bacterium]
MPAQPPKKALQFLRWFCREDFLEEIEGDLIELFAIQFPEASRQASWTFFWWVLRYFRPEFIKSFQSGTLMNTALVKHNLLISYRGFTRNKTAFLINLIGLSTSLATAFFIVLWVQSEWKMDRFHEKDERLYQVMQNYQLPEDKIKVTSWTPGPLSQGLRDEFPELEYATSFKTGNFFDGILSASEQAFKATPVYADQDFLQVFSFPLITGDKSQVLTEPGSAVISQSLAKKLFGTAFKAVGQTVEWNKSEGASARYKGSFIISGVIEDISPHSSMQFDILLPYQFFMDHTWGVERWNNHPVSTAMILRQGVDLSLLDQKITQLVQAKDGAYNGVYFLKQFSSQYLYGTYENGVLVGGRIDYLWLFVCIACLILIIASINFMNLSTAKASIRLKEIGVKKTLGVSRGELIGQFITESLLLSFLALLVAFVLVAVLLQPFNAITGKQLSLNFSLIHVMLFTGITVLTGLLSSTYPAFYLSAFKPIQVLKGKIERSVGELWIRQGLVVFQFVISIFLIVAVLVISQQMSYIHNKNLGYDRHHILSLRTIGPLFEKMEPFFEEIRKLPEVQSIANSNTNLVACENFTWQPLPHAEGEHTEHILLNVFIVTPEFLQTYGIQIKEGRNFSKDFGTETSKVILNETAVKEMGLNNPIGSMITFWDVPVEVIGVVKDFRYHSMYKRVEPCIFRLFNEGDNFGRFIWIKLEAGQQVKEIDKIADVYQQFNPGLAMEYGFVDEEYQQLYESENRVAALSKYFAVIAILISCLGLFGLAAFTAEKRTKEIGIRKILGASEWRIVTLLSKDFTVMVLMAILIAMPLSFVIGHRWLESFADKIQLQSWVYVLAAAIALLIAWLTVGVQTFRAARANPVNSLRAE